MKPHNEMKMPKSNQISNNTTNLSIKEITQENPTKNENEQIIQEEQKLTYNYSSLLIKEKILDSKIILESFKMQKLNTNEASITNGQQLIQHINEFVGKDADNLEYNYEHLLNAEYFFLGTKNITKIANLEIYTNLQELCLQGNKITKIEGLEFLQNLILLNLNHNYITMIEGLDKLLNLKILNLADNMIEKFNISTIPKNISYLYLFDNLFYEEVDIFSFRSICICYFPHLIRLDYLNISNLERMILIDKSNLRKISLIVKKKLNYVLSHYEDFKNERKTLLEEFKAKFQTKSQPDSNQSYELSKSMIDYSNTEESTTNLADLLKIKSQQRVKDFEESSNERMKDLKIKLEEVRNKFKSIPIIDDDRKKKIENKITNALKVEEKMKKAESITQKLLRRKIENKESTSNQIHIEEDLAEKKIKQMKERLDLENKQNPIIPSSSHINKSSPSFKKNPELKSAEKEIALEDVFKMECDKISNNKNPNLNEERNLTENQSFSCDQIINEENYYNENSLISDLSDLSYIKVKKIGNAEN
jgi:hypothetical protein